jgi:hypothetical protein
MLKPSAFFIIVLLTTSHCSDDAIQRENFVGQWRVTQVVQDGVQITGWSGSHLTIEQDKVDGGQYSMNDTKDDSIWNSNGTWAKSDEEQKLILDDTLTVIFAVETDKLTIVKWLQGTGQPTCDNGICLPVVTGNWFFEFERNK